MLAPDSLDVFVLGLDGVANTQSRESSGGLGVGSRLQDVQDRVCALQLFPSLLYFLLHVLPYRHAFFRDDILTGEVLADAPSAHGSLSGALRGRSDSAEKGVRHRRDVPWLWIHDNACRRGQPVRGACPIAWMPVWC